MLSPSRRTVTRSASAKYFLHPMRDVDYADALGAEIPDDSIEQMYFLLRERGCRLIHDQNARSSSKRACDFDQLLFGHRELAHLRVGINFAHQYALEVPVRGFAAQPSVCGSWSTGSPNPAPRFPPPSGRERGPVAGKWPQFPSLSRRRDRAAEWPFLRSRCCRNRADERPVMTLMSVDLPAPFSPSKACTSPRWRSNDTPLSARTAWNDFVMFLSWRRGGACIYRN